MSERRLLQEHGTSLNRLKPSSVISAAAADLALKERKRFDRETNQAAPYAFHRKHVRAAADPPDLLRRAQRAPADGRVSAKLQTRVIYADEQLLREALAIAGGQP